MARRIKQMAPFLVSARRGGVGQRCEASLEMAAQRTELNAERFASICGGFASLTKPPRLRPKEREHLLIAQPPLLSQGGE